MTTTTTTYPDPTTLSAETVLAEHRQVDWLKLLGIHDDGMHTVGEGWEWLAAADCAGCGNVVVAGPEGMLGESHCENCEATAETLDGPMMNYLYPLPARASIGDLEVHTLANLPLCFVFDSNRDEQGLALTGGGMDLTWEIAEGYMRLGYLPPLAFCSLPAMAGRGAIRSDGEFDEAAVSDLDRWVIAGCIASTRWVEQRGYWLRDSLANLIAPSDCTGAVDDDGRVQHDGDTCPVHEAHEPPRDSGETPPEEPRDCDGCGDRFYAGVDSSANRCGECQSVEDEAAILARDEGAVWAALPEFAKAQYRRQAKGNVPSEGRVETLNAGQLETAHECMKGEIATTVANGGQLLSFRLGIADEDDRRLMRTMNPQRPDCTDGAAWPIAALSTVSVDDGGEHHLLSLIDSKGNILESCEAQ